MQELLLKIQNDSTLMLMAGLALVVLLVIVLVVIVSAMKVKIYKDKFDKAWAIHSGKYPDKCIRKADKLLWIQTQIDKECKLYSISNLSPRQQKR